MIEIDRRNVLDEIPDINGPKESGRGIAIMQSVMDSLEYTAGDRNRLRLTRRLRRLESRV